MLYFLQFIFLYYFILLITAWNGDCIVIISPILFSQFVEEENARGLKEALILSKLDFEANLKNQQKKEEVANAKTKKKKKDKPSTFSLSDFNSMNTREVSFLRLVIYISILIYFTN